jgi:hypothetical protein
VAAHALRAQAPVHGRAAIRQSSARRLSGQRAALLPERRGELVEDDLLHEAVEAARAGRPGAVAPGNGRLGQDGEGGRPLTAGPEALQ